MMQKVESHRPIGGDMLEKTAGEPVEIAVPDISEQHREGEAGNSTTFIAASSVHEGVVIPIAKHPEYQDHGKPSDTKGGKKKREVSEIDPRKGDVFTNPKTGERLVVEGKTKEDIYFTRELKPDVRAMPGGAISSMSPKRFDVMQKTGEYMEYTPTYEAELDKAMVEFDEIFDACQDAFEKELIKLENSESKLTQKEWMAVERISRAIGKVEDEWDGIGDKKDYRAAQKKFKLLKELKDLTIQLPEKIVIEYVVLQNVIEHRIAGEGEFLLEDPDEDEVESGGMKPKGKPKKFRNKDDEDNGAKQNKGIKDKKNMRKREADRAAKRGLNTNMETGEASEPEVLTRFKFEVDNVTIPIQREIEASKNIGKLRELRPKIGDTNRYDDFIKDTHEGITALVQEIVGTNNREMEVQAIEYLKFKNNDLVLAWQRKKEELLKEIAEKKEKVGKGKLEKGEEKKSETDREKDEAVREEVSNEELFAQLVERLSPYIQGGETLKDIEGNEIEISLRENEIRYKYKGQGGKVSPSKIKQNLEFLKAQFPQLFEEAVSDKPSGEKKIDQPRRSKTEAPKESLQDQAARALKEIEQAITTKKQWAEQCFKDQTTAGPITKSQYQNFLAYLGKLDKDAKLAFNDKPPRFKRVLHVLEYVNKAEFKPEGKGKKEAEEKKEQEAPRTFEVLLGLLEKANQKQCAGLIAEGLAPFVEYVGKTKGLTLRQLIESPQYGVEKVAQNLALVVEKKLPSHWKDNERSTFALEFAIREINDSF